MGTLEKSPRNHEISISKRRFAKKRDFRLRNASDHVKDTIRTGSRKMMDFEQKMFRIGKNHGTSVSVFANRLLERVRTRFGNVRIPKILDGDPKKIVQKLRNFDFQGTLCEKKRFPAPERFRPHRQVRNGFDHT